MTDKEAIELLRTIKRPTLATGFKRQTDLLQAIEIVLNLVQTQQKEIEKKDKIIDEMTNWIDDRCYYSDNYGNSCEIIQDSCYNNDNCNVCIKEYFINKVEKEI